MNLQALLHEPKSQLGYANPDGSVTIRMRTEANDVKSVMLIYGDKYIWSQKEKIEMSKRCSDGVFDYYEVVVKVPHKRLAYYFELFSKHPKHCYYTEWGPTETLDEGEVDLMYFNYPYINKEDIHVVPEWIEKAIFYQIFPERFANGDTGNDPKDTVPWNSLPTRENFLGGDLKGIEDHLDHLVNLGINAIYMTPVFKSPSNHKYNTTDYLKIDPDFGTEEDLKRLVKKCHENGIRVVLDAVFNHSGLLFEPFQDVLKNGENSKYKDWFHIERFPVTTEPPNYETFSFEAYMPKLNTGNHEVIEYLCEVGKYWIEKADIDGWRLDVANEVDHEFWRSFKKAVRSVKKDAYILGEIWHNAKPWLMGDQFDGAMNYPFTRACLNFFAKGEISAHEFSRRINATYMRNTSEANKAMLNILDSHDTPRFITRCEGHVGKLKLAALFQMSFVGAPSVYYGTEIGMQGGADPECRKGMVWDENHWDLALMRFYKVMIALRTERASLRSENFEWIQTKHENVLAYIKKNENEKTFIIMNNDHQPCKVKLSGELFSTARCLGGEAHYSRTHRGMSVQLSGYEFLILDLDATL